MQANVELLDRLRELPPLMPQFLRRRRVGLAAPSEIAAELGIERALVFMMVQLEYVAGMYGHPEAGATLAQLRGYDPYAVIDNISPQIAALREKRLVLEGDEGLLCLSPQAQEAVDELQRQAIAFLAKREPLPPDTMEALAAELERAAAAVRANSLLASLPGNHLRGYVAAGRRSSGNPAPMVRIEQAIFELWGARDDAHTTAWRSAGMEGPPFDILSHLWTGVSSLSALAEALKPKQSLEDIESGLAWLAEHDYAQRHGDQLAISPTGVMVREDVERETDRIYFTGWPFSLHEVIWLRDTLRELVSKL